MELAGMCPMKEYIQRRQEKIADYIYNLPIYEICSREDHIQGSIRFFMWWGQDLTLEAKVDGFSEEAEREVG